MRPNVYVSGNITFYSTDDVGLYTCRLPRPAITVNEDVEQIVIPACLGWSDLDSDLNVPTTTHLVAGWGRTNNDRQDVFQIFCPGTQVQKNLTNGGTRYSLIITDF